jgi:hypothetical protein
MQKIQEQISNEFLTRLKGSQDFSDEMIEKLRELLVKGEKLKAEEIEKIFSDEENGALK